MSFAYPLTGIVTLLTLMVYFRMALKVGQARSKHDVPAPTMTGPDEFMRALRVHENTMEGMLLFLPSLWLFALTTHDVWAAVIGIFYPIGRLLYARGYYEAANKRSRGFMVGIITTVVLLLGALISLTVIAFQTYA